MLSAEYFHTGHVAKTLFLSIYLSIKKRILLSSIVKTACKISHFSIEYVCKIKY